MATSIALLTSSEAPPYLFLVCPFDVYVSVFFFFWKFHSINLYTL